MNYVRIYTQLIEASKSKLRSKKTGYYELHHIKPKCVGGSDEPGNLVLLTPREHFIAHVLLYKITPIRILRDPILFFKGKDSQYYNARLYEKARVDHIKEMRTNNPSTRLSDESKASKSLKLKSLVRTADHKQNLSNSLKGKQSRLGATLSSTSKEQISDSVKKWYREVGVSDTTRAKLSLTWLGKEHTAESKEKMIASARNRKTYDCPTCGLINMDGGNFNQHMKRKHEWTTDECVTFKINYGILFDNLQKHFRQ